MNKLFLIICLFVCSICCACRSPRPSNRNDSIIKGIDAKHKYIKTEEFGFPLISDTLPSTIIERIGYFVSYNKKTKQPNWVMWNLTATKVLSKKTGIWNDYVEDMKFEIGERASNDDYNHSGFDRGHMCPGADCNWDEKAREETFLLSNICPQNPNLNRGDWKEIEIACRKWAQQYGYIYIVCGPIFFRSQEHKIIGLNQIPVPEAFFKVVLCTAPSNPRGIGFICRNTDANREKDFYVNSIRQVERITGFKFFPTLHDSIKRVVFEMDDINEW